MTGGNLRNLLARRTQGEWKAEDGGTYLAGRGWWVEGPEHYSHDGDISEADARLIALAPEAVQLLADMADHVKYIGAFLSDAPKLERENTQLLARYGRLDQQAGQQ